MERLIDSIYENLKNENWIGALFIALALPDICGKVDYPGIKSSKERYKNWFDDNLQHKYIIEVGANHKRHIFLTGNDLYAFRCAMLHEGSENIENQKAREVLQAFILLPQGSHLNYFSNNNNSGKTYLQISIRDLCLEICESVKKWIESKGAEAQLSFEIRNYPFTIDGIRFSG